MEVVNLKIAIGASKNLNLSRYLEILTSKNVNDIHSLKIEEFYQNICLKCLIL